jgi:hypothetical protein
VRVYQDLAFLYAQQGQAQMRDRFLVLAADAMQSAGRLDEAEKLRQRLLQVNPHNLFKPFRSVAEAMKTADVKSYVDGLRRTYPPEKAAQLLESMRGDKPESDSKSGPKDSAPVVTIPGPAPEQLKIFGFQEEKAAPRAAAAGAQGTPIAVSTRSQSASPRWAALGTPTSWRGTAEDADVVDDVPGAWLSTGLFWILLAAAIALLVYSLGGPFLPL